MDWDPRWFGLEMPKPEDFDPIQLIADSLGPGLSCGGAYHLRVYQDPECVDWLEGAQ